jgi:hypothetical protein
MNADAKGGFQKRWMNNSNLMIEVSVKPAVPIFPLNHAHPVLFYVPITCQSCAIRHESRAFGSAADQ